MNFIAKRKTLFCVLLVSKLIVLVGCVSQEKNNADVNILQKITKELSVVKTIYTNHVKQNSEYLLQKGDLLEIKFFYNPELNQSVRIRPDGKISLQLINEIVAVGKSPSQLKQILLQQYSQKLSRPEVGIIVKEFANLNVYVGGEVKNGGLLPMNGNMTLMQAIFYVGGYKKTAELKNVVILRNQGTKVPEFITVDIGRVLAQNNSVNDLLLRHGDIIFVPRSEIAKFGDFVDLYINDIIPVALSMGFTYNLNPEVEIK